MKITLLYIIAIFPAVLTGQDLGGIVNLQGEWKFSIGDRQEWSSPDFDDWNWEKIKVPSYWEDEGFHGYDGYGWYRKSFFLPKEYSGRSFILRLGFIDDVDEVYINGNFVGRTGSFPPDYETAYNIFRQYPVPQRFLRLNENNVISVRVYDSQLGGGITGGEQGLYYQKILLADYNLEGVWKFSQGDDPDWSETGFDDRNWENIIVPGFWENQGYRDYDGFAWYRTSFQVPENLQGKRLVMLMGKIDDFDEVYVNGVMIGSTGDIRRHNASDEYNRFRGYFIPDGLLKEKNNIIAVRVRDTFLGGGIYLGPIGLVRQEKYTSFWKSQRRKKNIFEILFGN